MIVRELTALFGFEVDRKTEQGITKSVNRVKRVAGTLAAVFVTGAVARGFRGLVELASEAEETANKFAAVFGDASQEVQKRIEETGRRTGAGALQLQQFASGIGALVKPTLGSAEAAGDLGAQMAELALDIASFNDVNPEEAFVAIRSGLIGSAEPLQRFGVDLRDAAVALEAQRQGLGSSTKALSEAQKVQLRSKLILRALTEQGALGDATKTATGFANASRALAATLKDLGALIGGFFLKSSGESVVALRELVMTTIDWIKANRELIRQNVERTLRIIGQALRTIRGALSLIIRGWGELISLIIGATGDMTSLNKAILGTVLGIGILGAILGAPFVLMLGLLALILVVAEDINAFLKGQDSLIGRIVEGFKRFSKELGGIRGLFIKVAAEISAALVQSFLELVGVSEENADLAAKAWKDAFIEVFDLLPAAFAKILVKTLGPIPSLLAEAFEAVPASLRSQIFGESVATLQGAGGAAQARLEAGAARREAVLTSLTNAPSTTIEVTVDARGANDPDEVGAQVARQVDTAQSILLLRQANNAFLVSGGT